MFQSKPKSIVCRALWIALTASSLANPVAWADEPCTSNTSGLQEIQAQVTTLSNPIKTGDECVEKLTLTGVDPAQAKQQCGARPIASQSVLTEKSAKKPPYWTRLDTGVALASAALIGGTAMSQHKSCIVGPLLDKHKVEHMLGSALISGGITLITGHSSYGIAAGLAAGTAREVYKNMTPGMDCEYASMTWDLVGTLGGAALARPYEEKTSSAIRYYLLPQHHGMMLGADKPF